MFPLTKFLRFLGGPAPYRFFMPDQVWTDHLHPQTIDANGGYLPDNFQ